MTLVLALIKAFLIGGLFCVAAQLLIDKTMLTPARILVGYVVLGIFLGAVGLYEPLYRFAGAGAATPLVGFGGNIAKGVREAVEGKGLLGVFSGALSAASVGTGAALCFGFVASLISRGKGKD